MVKKEGLGFTAVTPSKKMTMGIQVPVTGNIPKYNKDGRIWWVCEPADNLNGVVILGGARTPPMNMGLIRRGGQLMGGVSVPHRLALSKTPVEF